MLTKNIQQMTAEIDAHRAADRLVQGFYFDADTGHGCFIGCLTHGNDTAAIAERFGLPEPLTRLLESIFERLPFDEAADFFSEIPRAIGRDGRDLTRVHWAFLADLLRHLPDTDARGVVADVTAGMDLLAGGKDWPAAEAVAAAEAAEAEARAAHWATRAARAARAAYWAAKAAEAAEAAAEANVAAVVAAAKAARAARAAYWAAKAAEAEAEANVAAVVAAATAAAKAAHWATRAARAALAAGAEETRRQRDAILRLIREVPAPAPDDRR